MKTNNIWSYIKSYKFNSMFIRTFLQVFLMFSIPFFLLNDMYYRNVEKIAKEEIMIENNSLLYGVRDISDTIISDCDRLCTYIAYNDNVQMFMINDWFVEINSDSMREFAQLVKALPLVYKYIDSIYVYSEYNQSVYNGDKKSPIKDFKDISWMEEYKRIEDVYGTTIARLKNNNYPELMSIIKPIMMDNEKKGAVVINIKSEKLHNVITTEKFLNHSNIFLINEKGSIIMSSDEGLFGQEIREIPYFMDVMESGSSGSVIKSIEGMDSVITVAPSVKFPFTYVSITSMLHYQNKLSQLQTQTLRLFVLLIVLCILIVSFTTIRSYKPVAEIISVLEDPQSFNDYGNPGKARLNELRYIISTILKQNQANESMKDELETKLKLLDQSQFAMLQSQINPHFLYNTLETINWMAFELTKSDNKVSKAVNSLAQLFRNNVYLGDYIIPISQEIENTKNYLDILELRYGDIFQVEWEVDEKVKEYSIIKICLQPIIENAVHHGLKPKGMDGLLRIRGEIRENEAIIFTISDNGVGMNRRRMEEINQKLNGIQNQMEEHIGIYNVNQRVKIVFGKEYGVSLTSEEMQGTEVSVIIPMVKVH